MPISLHVEDAPRSKRAGSRGVPVSRRVEGAPHATRAVAENRATRAAAENRATRAAPENRATRTAAENRATRTAPENRATRAAAEDDEPRAVSLERGATLDTLRRRAELLARMRAFFAARGVLEVETPALSAAAPSDPAIESIAARVERLGGTRYLTTSPEFPMKRLLADGIGDVYQLCRVFRDGEIGRWHQPEFTMLEWYRVGFDDAQLMDDVEALVRHTAGNSAAAWPARRITYRNAFVEFIAVDPFDDADAVVARLRERGIDVPPGLDADGVLDLAFAALVMPALPRDAWTFVHDYPASQASLARLKPGCPAVAARFELFAGGVELANGFAELTDAAEQRRRFERDQAARRERGQPLRPLDDAFLAALERGLPDCAGVALGIDRLLAVALDLPSVTDAVAFAHHHHPTPRR